MTVLEALFFSKVSLVAGTDVLLRGTKLPPRRESSICLLEVLMVIIALSVASVVEFALALGWAMLPASDITASIFLAIK